MKVRLILQIRNPQYEFERPTQISWLKFQADAKVGSEFGAPLNLSTWLGVLKRPSATGRAPSPASRIRYGIGHVISGPAAAVSPDPAQEAFPFHDGRQVRWSRRSGINRRGLPTW